MKKIITLFLGLFLYYAVICLYTLKVPPGNDEYRYLEYAHNLTKGFYAPKDTLLLWNGPGYPLVLYPFVKMGLPFWAGKCLNPLFLSGGVLFLYFLLRSYVGGNRAVLGALLFGLYPPLLPDMVRLLTEPLSIFLVCGFCFFVVRSFQKKRGLLLLWAGIFGGGLILTKLVFAYVVIACLLFALLWAVIRDNEMWRFVAVCGLSLLFCVPYLYYTWSLTHRFFYWGNAGGSLLYWISDPCKDHLGDWHAASLVKCDARYAVHKPLYEQLSGMDFVRQDDLMKQEAIQNLKTHPVKFLYNCAANTGRLWLNYPYTYKELRPQILFYMVPNAILLSGVIFSIYPLVRAFRGVNREIILLIFFAVVYLALSTLLSANARYLVPVVPILIVLVIYAWFAVLEIHFKNPGLRFGMD